MQRKHLRRTRDVLMVSSTGIALGYVTPTLVDGALMTVHAVMWVMIVGAVGWALLLFDLLEILGVL